MKNDISPAALHTLQAATTAAQQMAHMATSGANGLVEEAWRDCKEATAKAPDIDAKAVVARRFGEIFGAFARFTFDDMTTLAIPTYSGDRAVIEAKRRAVLDRHPALAAWNVERDQRAAELQERIDRNAANLAERIRQGLPALILKRLRDAGFDLTVDKHGRLCAPPGAPLEKAGDGLAVYTDRKADFVAILKAEADAAAAEARQLVPVVIAA